jgi:carboxyl-terminal processing protease
MHRLAIALLVALPIAGAIALAGGAPRASSTPSATIAEVDGSRADPDMAAVASTVAYTMITGHYTAESIDDARSREWLSTFLDDLDPQRLYLLKSDVDEFQRWANRLDEDILSPEPSLEAPFAIHARYRQRVAERVAAASRMLAEPMPLDGSLGEVEVDREKAAWAANTAALDAVWRTRLAEQVLSMKLGDDRPEPPEVRLRKRYERIGRDVEETEREDILEAWLGALTRTFDPHSVWFKPISKENFDIDMRDTLTGVGAVLGQEDGYVTINELVDGGPAKRSEQLKPKDTILAVAQGDGPPVDVVEMRLDKVVQLIRGKEGTEVVLTVHPVDAADPAETRQVRIIREKVKLAQSAAKGELREIPAAGGPVKLGLIDVPSFYVDTEGQRAGDKAWGSTARDVAALLATWKGSVDVVVLDLRQNGGGSLDQALELTGLFLDNGPVVQIRDREGEIEVLKDPSEGALWTGPVVVLTSELSASASEIFAAALQDYGRALVVGSPTTHGKGSVQNLVSLERYLVRTGHPEAAPRSGALKYTTHMFFRVNGNSTQTNGVAADVVLPSYYAGLDILEADIPHALPHAEIPAARYKTQPRPFDLAALQTASQARVAVHPEFKQLADDIAERERYRADNTLSLDLDDRRAEQEADEAQDKARDEARKAAGWDGEAEIDAVLDEALLVARDYVLSLDGKPVAKAAVDPKRR